VLFEGKGRELMSRVAVAVVERLMCGAHNAIGREIEHRRFVGLRVGRGDKLLVVRKGLLIRDQ
jgi:hypothetical protein